MGAETEKGRRAAIPQVGATAGLSSSGSLICAESMDIRERSIPFLPLRVVIPCTRPTPLLRSLAQPASHGVIMDVVNHGQNCLRLGQIPIIPWPLLPKSKRHHSWALADGEGLEERAPAGLQMLFDPKRERPFDRSQQLIDARSLRFGTGEEVHVGGHVDKGHEPIVVSVHRLLDTVAEESPADIIGQ